MKKEADRNIWIFGILYFITLLEICLVWRFHMIELFVCLKLVFNAMIGIVAVILIYEKIKVLEVQKEREKNIVASRWFIVIGYLISLFLVLLSAKEQVYELWMFGTMWIAFFVSPYMAMGFHVVFTYLYCIINNMGVETFVLYVLLGWITCGLSGSMKKKKTFLVSMVILVSMHITIMLLMNFFPFNRNMADDMLYSIGTYILGLILVFIAHFIQERKRANTGQRKIIDKKSKKEYYQGFLNTDFPLVQKLQEHSKYLYRHSLRVAVGAGEAAKAIGADELLAQVGGLYHDIGKIVDGNYIENGKKLALEYGLPEEVTVIIESHNIKFHKPETIEAAVVMFTNDIISYMELLKARHGDLTKNRYAIIQKIFEVRLEDGTLDDIGFTLEQYKTLIKYFKEHI